MRGPPRCPVCKAWLTADRTVSETWQGFEAGRERSPGITDALWEYRLACPGCLSVVRVERAELSKRGRSSAGRSSVEVAGAVVSRLRERIGAVGNPEEAVRVLEEVRLDTQVRLLLRVPEIFSLARPWYGKRVTAAEETYFWALRSPMGEAARSELKRLSPGEALVEVGSDLTPLGNDRWRVRVGTPLAVQGSESTSFLLTLPPSPAEAAGPGWVDLVAYPDLVRPADPW